MNLRDAVKSKLKVLDMNAGRLGADDAISVDLETNDQYKKT